MSKKNKVRTKKILKKLIVYCLLLILFIIGGYLRVHGVIDGSFSFTYDIGRDLLVVSEMVQTLKPTLLGPTTGFEGLFYGPWWYYFLLVPFLVFQGDPTYITLFIALIGASNIILGFILGKKIGGDFIGIIIAVIISTSQYLIGLSTQIWSPNLIPTFVLLILFILHTYLSQKESRITLFIFAGLIIGLTIEMEIMFGLIFLLSLVLFSLFFLRRISKKRVLYFLMGMGIIELPRLIFEFRHSFLMSKRILGFSTQSSSILLNEIFRRENFVELRYVFENLVSTTLSGNNSVLGYLLILFSVFVFFFYYKKANDTEKKLNTFILLTCFIFYLAFALYPKGLWNHYLVGLPVLFIVFLAIAINLLKKHFYFPKVVYVLPVVLAWVNISPVALFIEQRRPLWEGNASVYRNQINVIDYVYKEAKGRDFKYVVYTPPIHDYTYRYLFPWHGMRKYGKAPKENAKLAYFIVEPDDDYGKRRLEWLDKRKTDGTIIKEEYLSGFILVQTRMTK